MYVLTKSQLRWYIFTLTEPWQYIFTWSKLWWYTYVLTKSQLRWYTFTLTELWRYDFTWSELWWLVLKDPPAASNTADWPLLCSGSQAPRIFPLPKIKYSVNFNIFYCFDVTNKRMGHRFWKLVPKVFIISIY